MFKFSTLNFINTEKYLDGKTPKFAASNDGKELFINSNRLVFTADTVKDKTVWKREGTYGKLAKATVAAVAPLTAKSVRFTINIRLSMASQDSLYANPFTFKGKPLVIEVPQDALTSDKKLKDYIKKYQLALYDTDMVDFSLDGNDVVITATNIYQKFTDVLVEEYVGPNADPFVSAYQDANKSVTIESNLEDFGTYHQLTKDMVLPTCEHLAWGSEKVDEKPVPGVLYNQYTIHMCAERENPTGLGAVGEVVTSRTTHVFYVNSALADMFEGELEKVFGSDCVKTVDKPTDYTVTTELQPTGSYFADATVSTTKEALDPEP